MIKQMFFVIHARVGRIYVCKSLINIMNNIMK